MSEVFEFPATQVKKMDNPTAAQDKTSSKKYVCYVKLQDIPDGFIEWMQTNPRDQNLKTGVARSINASIVNGARNFHEINRGIVMSVSSFSYDNKSEKIKVTLEDPTIHGNIDGGHTLRIILENKAKNRLIYDYQYVFFEFFTGIGSPVELAETRNTSVQVDDTSIEELKKTFECIKDAIRTESYFGRVAFKQNEHNGVSNIIDVKEIVAIINMFNQSLYPMNGDTQPTQSYTGKAASLNRFTGLKGHDQIIKNMTPIIPDIFKLWDTIETTFADKANTVGKRYRKKKYARTEEGKMVATSMFGDSPMDYFLPKGLLYPLVGAFRALVQVDSSTQVYSWKLDPFTVWDEIGGKLISIILGSSEDLSDSPDAVGKSSNTWNLLFKEVFVYAFFQTF